MNQRLGLPAPIYAVLAAHIVVSLAACVADSSDRSSWQAAYDTIGDTLIVRTLAGGAWGDAAELVAELTVGQFEGPDEYMFGQINSLAVGPDGSIYIFDRQVPALRKYAADGTYIETIGREGGGPGEYKRPDGGLAVLPDGRVLLRDPGNARISVFGPDGEYLESWRIRGGFNTSRPLFADTAGNAYTMILIDPQATVTEWQVGLVRYGPDGTPGDTIPAPIWDYEPSEIVATHVEGDNQSTSVNDVPFSPRSSWTFSPLGYLVGGLSTRYAIDLFVAADRVTRIERADWQPVPVLPAERDEQERIATANMRSVDPTWRWTADPIPDTKPPFAGMFVGGAGRIWVLLHQQAYQIEVDEPESTEPSRPWDAPPRTWVEPVAFDVFEPDGRYLGMVRAPEGFSTRPWPVIRGDTVWAVVRDELDVPYLVRFRIAHPEGSEK